MSTPRCYAAGRGDPCDHARQRHHVVKQSKIDRVHAKLKAEHKRGRGPKPWSLTRAKADKRNLVWTCWRHHKPIEEHIEIRDLPPGFWDFVATYDLYPELPRHLKAIAP
jgi:hypothetical protein